MKKISSKGIVLIEAVISVVIIAVTLGIIMQSLMSSYRILDVQRDYSKSLVELENYFYHVVSMPSETDDSNHFDDGEVKIERSSSELVEGLKKETFTANLYSSDQSRRISLVTFTFNAPHEQKQDTPN